MPRPLAEKRIYVPRGKNRIIYVFNAKGEQVDSGQSKDIALKYGVKQLRSSVKRECMWKGMYYFSLNPDFKIKEVYQSKNPEVQKKIKERKEKEQARKEEMKKYHINYKP
jgi:hypothetical protein